MSALSLTLAPAQVDLDAHLGSTILQALLLGVYAVIFSNAIGPIVRDRRIVLITLLIVLFCLVIISLGATWHHVREVFITHNSTRDTMFLAFTQQTAQTQLVTMTLITSVLVADSLMIWRCFILWQESTVIISLFGILFLAEIVLFPLTTLQSFDSTKFNPTPMICVFLLVSVCITVCATSLIIYRIKHATTSSSHNTYTYLIEVLAQSGALYSTTLLIIAVQLIARTHHPHNHALLRSTSYLGGIVAPITGISTTLVSSRITSRASRNSKTSSPPVSQIVFEQAAQSENYIANNEPQFDEVDESRHTALAEAGNSGMMSRQTLPV